MPRFYFNVYNGKASIDTAGVDLPDWDSACEVAICYLGSFLKVEAPGLDPSEEWRMEVTDITGLVLFRLDFTVPTMAATDGLRRN